MTTLASPSPALHDDAGDRGPGDTLASLALVGFPPAAARELAASEEFEVTAFEPSASVLRAALGPDHDFDVIAFRAQDAARAAELEAVIRQTPPRQAALVVGESAAGCFGDSASLPYDVWYEPDESLAAAIFTPLLRSVREREALIAIESHRRITNALDEVLTAQNDLGDAVAGAMGVLADGLSCEGAAFWRPSASGRTLIRVGCTGAEPGLDRAASGDDRLPAPDCDRLLELPVAGTPVGEVLLTGRPRFPVGGDTFLLLPACANGRVAGVVVLTGGRRVVRRRSSFELAHTAADRVAALIEWQAANQRFNAVTARSPLAIVLTDANGMVDFFNEAAQALCGIAPEDALDRPAIELLAPEFRATERPRVRELIRAARAQQPLTIELGVAPVGAPELFIELSLSSWGHGTDRRYALTMQDVTERHRAARQIAQLAYTDHVTGLPNRAALLRDLEGSDGVWDALVAVEIDHFDRFVDALGTTTADALVAAVADRLRRSVPSATDVYHLNRETFLLATSIADRTELLAGAARLCARVAEPLDVAGVHLYIKTSAGLCLLAGEREVGVDAVDAALLALRQARETESAHPCIYDPEHPHDRDRLRRERDLHTAVHEGQLRLVYQPIVALDSGRVHHFEALIRWQHPELGLLAPGRFIDLAEENGLIIEIGDWVAEEACRQLALWQREHGFGGSISFNVAPRQLLAGDLAGRITAAAARHRVDPRHLVAEVVESAALRDLATASSSLQAVRDAGLAIALDDFGVGESSLGRLAGLPVDILKIDRSLIRGLPGDRGSRAVTHSAIHLARELGLDVITEGIETPEQRDHLAAAGSRFGQGYLFGRPQPPEQAAGLIIAG